ncbi:MAG: hypothetical protein NC206_03630 [Bacteroides sp.]|nr:hypothetical protein [Roseburia sp.]MCM1346157.1 hypothetical protein [Bacteroides sp.]MCM1420960.1 hypothetical protein [Bacteroides sp.]
MEQESQTLRLFETIKLYNLILEKNSTSGIVCGHFLHSMLFYVVQTYKYMSILCDKWSESLPYSRHFCKEGWDKWYSFFMGICGEISSIVVSNSFNLSAQTAESAEDEVSVNELNTASGDYVFDKDDEMDMEVSKRFKNDVLGQLRNIDSTITDINDYLYLIVYYINKICSCIKLISKILRRPSADKILKFFNTASLMYMRNMRKNDVDTYLDKKVSVPECELVAFAGKTKQEYWNRLCQSGFMDKKKNTICAPHIEDDNGLDKLAYKCFFKPDGTFNEDAVSKYIFFNRSELTDEQINSFFGYEFMVRYIDQDISHTVQKNEGKSAHMEQITHAGGVPNEQAVRLTLDYVSQLSELEVPRYAGRIHEIWETMFKNERMCEALKPKSREKSKAAGFSKKFVCHIISFLWTRGYYQGSRVDFVCLLEHGDKNHSIKNYITSDMEMLSDKVRRESKETINCYNECQTIIESILEEQGQ